MKKEKNFSKFNTRIYNDKLEEILEKKTFSENVKNNILNMIYKIEEAYNDYELVKKEVPAKKEFFDKILYLIDKYCYTIEILNTDEMNEKKYVINYEKGDIKVCSNNVWLLYTILNIINIKKYYQNEENLIKNKPIYDFLNLGYNINNTEVIRDFNGWSWTNSLNESKDISINLIYQNLQFLLGNKFIENFMQNIIIKDDKFLNILQNKLENKYNKEIANELIDLLNKIAIIEISKIDKEYKESILKIRNQKLEEYNLMENKKEYLQNIFLIKKSNIETIKEIDKLINNPENLKQEYKSRNSILENNEKIFSVSCLVEILNKERQEALEKITEINMLMEPKNYVRKKLDLENIVKNLSVEDINCNEYIIEFQKKFIKCLVKTIEGTSEKLDIINILYKVRYYIYCSIDKDRNINEVIEIKKELEILKEKIVQKLIENNLIFEFSIEKELSKKILMTILETRIINLQSIYIMLTKIKNELRIDIYDEDELVKSENIIIEDLEIKNLKLGKKIKVFV